MNYRRNEDMLCGYSDKMPPAYSGVIGEPVFSAEETTEPVTLAEVKQYLRVDASETAFDAEITALIGAARDEVETYLNRSLIRRTVAVTMNIANGDAALPYAPVVELTAITDIDGNAMDESNYMIKGDVLKISSYLGYSQLSLTYTAGYTTEKPVPAAFKLGIKKLIAFDWQHKGDDNTQRKVGLITGLSKYRRVV